MQEQEETTKPLQPNLGMKSRRGQSKNKRTYLGENAMLTLPALIPAEIKQLKLKNQEKALKLLDDHIEEAIQVLIDGLTAEDKWFRFNCACTLIKKVLPDRKSHAGDTETDRITAPVDKRTLVFNIVNVLDEIGFEDLRQRTQDGSFRLSEHDSRGKGETQRDIFAEEGNADGREGPGEDQSSRESIESITSSEV